MVMINVVSSPVQQSTCPHIDPECCCPLADRNSDTNTGEGSGSASLHSLQVDHDGGDPVPGDTVHRVVCPALPVPMWVHVNCVLAT